MFDFINGIYCTLFGWFISPESCSDFKTNLSLHKRTDVDYMGNETVGGKHKKTRKHMKHKTKKNKTQSNKHKYFMF
jgi:hypothetical protein